MVSDTPVAPTAADFEACLAQSASVVQTGCGLVEYAERGSGPALLSVHGSPGGSAQGLLFAEYFRANGFRVIAPSRPGYAGTPLTTGRSISEQADALVALLDVLGLERVALLGASGGGPAAYTLAGRHPQRVACLLQVDSVALPVSPSRLERLTWSSRPLVAVQLRLVDHGAGRMVTMMGGTPARGPQAAAQAALLRTVILSGSDWPRTRPGYDNDDAQFASLSPLPLAQITCPTLIVHGSADTTVPTGHAERAQAAIAGSQLRWIPGGRHAAFWLSPDAQHDALSFLIHHHHG
jgi:pimeloyl-ACP methyl ester carboxylesterase